MAGYEVLHELLELVVNIIDLFLSTELSLLFLPPSY